MSRGGRLDKLGHVRLGEVRQAVMAWLHATSNTNPENLIVAGAVAFLALCRHQNIDPRRALEVSERVLRNAQDREPVEARALRLYLENEL